MPNDAAVPRRSTAMFAFAGCVLALFLPIGFLIAFGQMLSPSREFEVVAIPVAFLVWMALTVLGRRWMAVLIARRAGRAKAPGPRLSAPFALLLSGLTFGAATFSSVMAVCAVLVRTEGVPVVRDYLIVDKFIGRERSPCYGLALAAQSHPDEKRQLCIDKSLWKQVHWPAVIRVQDRVAWSGSQLMGYQLLAGTSSFRE